MPGSIAKMQEAARLIDRSNEGYDQGQRWTFWDGSNVVPNKECDCSTCCGVIAKLGGYDVDLAGTFYTGNMGERLQAAGFEKIKFSSLGQVKAGDIIVNTLNHVEFAYTAKEFFSAHIDENGRISGGIAGNQTGSEVGFGPAYVYAYGGWDYIYRPPEYKPKQGWVNEAQGWRFYESDDAVRREFRLDEPYGEAWLNEAGYFERTTGWSDEVTGKLFYRQLGYKVQHSCVQDGLTIKADGRIDWSKTKMTRIAGKDRANTARLSAIDAVKRGDLSLKRVICMSSENEHMPDLVAAENQAAGKYAILYFNDRIGSNGDELALIKQNAAAIDDIVIVGDEKGISEAVEKKIYEAWGRK